MTARRSPVEHDDARLWLPAQGRGVAKCIIIDPPYAVGTPVRGREDGAAGSVYGPFENLHRWLTLTADVLMPGGLAMIYADWRRMSDIGYLCSISGLRPATCVAWIRNRPGTGGLLRAAWDPILIAARGVPDAVDRAAIRNVVETFEDDAVVRADYPGKRRHPYDKPLETYRHVLTRICRQGDLVLDPFAGTGGSGDIAAGLGLDWHGCDVDRDHAEVCYQDDCTCTLGRAAS
jgi:DNA modification methylase